MVGVRGHPSSGLRIAVDLISAGSGFHPGAGGMISYYDGLLRSLCERADVHSVVAFTPPWNSRLGVPDSSKIQVVRCRGLARNRPARVAYEQLALPLLAWRFRADVLLATVNVMPLLRRAPTVVVLQSIQSFLWPGQAGPFREAYLRTAVPRSLRRAGAVITVTEAERRDALRLFDDIDPDQVMTVHHGVSPWTHEALTADPAPRPWRHREGRPYVLAISRLYAHKNHARLILAFAKIAKEVEHDLVIAGGDADVSRAELERLAGESGVGARVRCLGTVSQDDVPRLFAGASALAYVSLYETFGHPVLEAFAFGLPLVTAGEGATAEVAGGAARLVDPEDVDEIASGIRDVLLDPELRARLGVAGRQRVREFTWERCADGTMRALMSALEQRPAAGPVVVEQGS